MDSSAAQPTAYPCGHDAELARLRSRVIELEEELRVAQAATAENARYRAVLEALMRHVPEGITIAEGPEIKITRISNFGVAMIGHGAEDVRDISTAQYMESFGIYKPDGTPALLEERPLIRACRTGEIILQEEWGFIRPDGSALTLLCNAGPMLDANGERIGGVVVWKDITEIRRSERALRESERRLSLALEANRLGTWDWNMLTGDLSWGGYHYQLFGLKKNEFDGSFEAFLRCLVPEDRIAVQSELTRVTAAREESYRQEYRTIWPDGTIRYLEGRGCFFYDDEGRPARMLGVVQDITARYEAEKALRIKEEHLRMSQAAAGVGSFEWNTTADRAVCSEEYLRLYGLPDGAALGSRDEWLAYVHPEDRSRVIEQLRRSIASGQGGESEYRIVRADGSQRWILARFDVHKDADGQHTRVIGANLDITGRKQVEEALLHSEAEFRQIADTLPQLVWVTRPDGHHEWFNRRWYDYTGATDAQSLGEAWANLFHPDDIGHAQRVWNESLATGQPYNVEYRCRRHDGSWRWFLGRAEPIRDEQGTIRRWFGTCTDIHDQKNTEAALRRSNQDLEQFAFAASHDLQEPLRTINSYSQLVARRYRGKLDEDADVFLGFILDGTRQMSRLIQDLLVYAQTTDSTELQLRPVGAGPALQRALTSLREKVEEVQPVLTWGALPVVMSVDGLLVQVLQNLISNALKYRRPDILCEIHVSAERQGNEWVFAVKDNGQGISPEQQHKVFGLFVRLHGREVSGTGIGLATVKRIVERQGGRIWLESQPKVGSTFYFSLQAADPLGVDDASEKRPAGSGPGVE